MSEFHFFSGDENDLPDGLAEVLRNLTSKVMFDSGFAHDHVADGAMPSEEQRGIGPGDLCAITHTEGGNPSEREFMIAEVLNPESYAEEFPDWETRLLNSYVLTRWYVRGNLPNGELGWLARAKLVVFSREHFDIMMTWIRGEDHGALPPLWLLERYNESLAGLAEANRESMPMPIRCPNCKSYAVMVKVTHISTDTYCMGTPYEKKDEPWTDLHAVSPYTKQHEITTVIDCLKCSHHEQLPDEVGLYG